MSLFTLFRKDKPKIDQGTSRKEGFSGWSRCPVCVEMHHISTIEASFNCCPSCSYHYPLHIKKRIAMLTDEGSFCEINSDLISEDPLDFVDDTSYKERSCQARDKTKRNEAVITGFATLDKSPYALAVLDFSFMGGSMGSVVGEKITRLIEEALVKNLPLLIVSASGGARMQESIFSLMQMAKTSAALGKFRERGLFYLSLLTHPTTGGVTASFASLGDIIMAEPGALIGFAGPRVIERSSSTPMPQGAQRSEFLKDHGMIDMVVARKDLRAKIAFFLSFFSTSKVESTSDEKTIFSMPVQG